VLRSSNPGNPLRVRKDGRTLPYTLLLAELDGRRTQASLRQLPAAHNPALLFRRRRTRRKVTRFRFLLAPPIGIMVRDFLRTCLPPISLPGDRGWFSLTGPASPRAGTKHPLSGAENSVEDRLSGTWYDRGFLIVCGRPLLTDIFDTPSPPFLQWSWPSIGRCHRFW